MNIRWRLGVVFIQLIALLIATYYATGELYSASTWFTAGLFSVIISSQILEPFYSRPADVIGNTVICYLLYLTTPKTVAQIAWNGFSILLIILFVLAIFSSLFGTGKEYGKYTLLAKAAKSFSTEATAVRIYSIVFWLSLIESYPKLERPLWVMGIAWAILIAFGLIDWQKIWEMRKTKDCFIEGAIAPSRIIVSTTDLPNPGSWVTLRTKEFTTKGVIISRIKRIEDVWGQIYLDNQEECEKLLRSHSVSYEMLNQTNEDVLGIADEGSSQENLVFQPNRPLEIGNVVSVQHGETEILYQIHTAKIQKLDVKGGSLLQTQAYAKQLGVFDKETLRLKQYHWSPTPGNAVTRSNLKPATEEITIPQSWMLLGNIIGSDIPIYLDKKLVCEGHLAILGMTKMGKTTFAIKLINAMANNRIITILDQTGEYKKRGIKPHTPAHDTSVNGIALLEPRPEEAITQAYKYLSDITTFARNEYERGVPKLRTVLVEEAHQFVPEPTLLDYKDPGRESAQKFGALMMQIRKYEINTILISQRTAVVAKSALSQCENFIAFRSFDKTGLEYLDTASGHEISNIIPTLKKGEAVVFGPAFSCDVPVAIKIIQEPEIQQQEKDSILEDVIPDFDEFQPEDEIPF
ncbi:MAG: DUF87 domain-containing protein [Chloroflexi bacterium]|nr:DUF87 domain-containing protein [Chloroflexota bacterium]